MGKPPANSKEEAQRKEMKEFMRKKLDTDKIEAVDREKLKIAL